MYFFLFRKRNKFFKSAKRSFQYTLFAIKLPHSDSKKDSDKRYISEKISIAEDFLNSLSGLKVPIILEISKENIGGEISFYIAIPKELISFIENQLTSFYPDIIINKVEDYNIFNPEGKNSFVFLKQKKNRSIPIKTYKELEVDSIASILNSFSKLKEKGEGLSFQIILKPAPGSIKRGIIQEIIGVKKGEVSEGRGELRVIARGFKEAIQGLGASEEPKQEKPRQVNEELLKSLQEKIAKTLFFANIRILSSAENELRAKEILNGMLGSFQQFSSPTRNSFVGTKPKNIRKFVFNYIFRVFNRQEASVFNSEELASLWHFPIQEKSAPQTKWAGSKQVAPPLELPNEGIVIGKSIFREEEKLFRIKSEDRMRHFYIIGQTGSGKSYMMTNMIIQDIKNGEGVCVIDPHGDLVEDILGYIPKERKDDVIFFNPTDLKKPLGLNMLEYDFNKPEQKSMIINELWDIFNKLYDMKQAGGPVFEQYMRNALLLVMSDKDEIGTLFDVQRVFVDDEYRARKLKKCKDPIVVEFWKKQAEKATGEHSLKDMSGYITSKFASFTSNDYMRPIIAQRKSAFNFREIMDNKKILLVSLPIGGIGDFNVSLLGLIFAGRIRMAAMSRIDIPPEQRTDFYLYMDEFQNFTTPSISSILAEARKYRLGLIMAHQYISQLDEKIREAVMGNVGTLVSFRIDIKDAEFLEKKFAPVFDFSDLIKLNNYNGITRTLSDNQPLNPFNFQTIEREKGDTELAKELIKMSQDKYGKDREEVEEDLLKRYVEEPDDEDDEDDDYNEDDY
jgi:hypothetical protein